MCLAAPLAAHRPITSRYAFYPDVEAVLAAHCVSCHQGGGDAPMALGSYAETRPWAEAIREQVAGGEMPPWFAEPEGLALADENVLAAREIDVLLDWASGGAPEGPRPAADAQRTSPPAGSRAQAPAGKPLEVVVPPDASSRILLEPTSDAHIAGFEVLPGGDRVVRGAWLLVDGTAAGAWSAGRGPLSLPHDAAWRAPAGSRVEVELVRGVAYVRGRRSSSVARLWLLETAASRVVRSIAVEGGGARSSLPAGAELLAVLPPAERRAPLLFELGCSEPAPRALRWRPGGAWPLAYALETPATLTAGEACAAVKPAAQRVTLLAAMPPATPAPPAGPPPRR